MAESAAERAYRVIRDAVLDGTHRPGSMLGEASLAAELGVSRTPVRAALTRLQEEGWITVYPKRGALVQGLSEPVIAELAEARFLLETLAVGRASPADRERLAEVLEGSLARQREAFAAADVRRFVELTLEFHRGFVEAGGNAVLLELYDRLADRQRFLLFAAGDRLLGRCADILAEHEQLIEHLRTGDAAGFGRVLGEHITEVHARRPVPGGGLPGSGVWPQFGESPGD